MPEAYALVKEVTKRVQRIALHDVQLIAGIALHQGKITEQKTGEGKTNTATLPLYLNSLNRTRSSFGYTKRLSFQAWCWLDGSYL